MKKTNNGVDGGGDDDYEPTLKILRQSMQSQKDSSGEVVMEMADMAGPSTVISFHEEEIKPASSSNSSSDGGQRNTGEVLKCTSFTQKSGLLRARTTNKSRLMDSPTAEQDRRSGEAIRSSEEDDTLSEEEDLPDEFKHRSFNTCTLFEWVSLVLTVAAFVSSLSIPYLRRTTLWDLHYWRWMLLIVVLMCGRLASGWGIGLLVFYVERNFSMRNRVLYFVYGVRNPVQNCLWLGLVLTAWHYTIDSKVKKETKNTTLVPYVVTRLLLCLLVTTVLWLVKTLLVKVLASSFHVTTYFDRIQDSLFSQYVIAKLSGPPLERNREEGSSQGFLSIDTLRRLNQKNVSAWNMKRLVKAVRHGVLATLDEQLRGHEEDDGVIQIKSEYQAKRAAKKIFQNVAVPGSTFICLEDVLRFMKEDQGLKTMNLFEGASETNKISKSALKNWVVNAFKERRALALTLDDTKTAIKQLHRLVNAVMAIVTLVIWLLILGIASTEILLFITSQLLLAAFMFGNTFRMLFKSIIFLFGMHPFDVGDRCEIDGVQMVVEEMNILTTVFLRVDNQKVIYPNSVLSTKPIGNYYRSPNMEDTIDFSVHISTPAEKLAVMKQRITSYIENKADHWQPAPLIVMKDVEDMNRVKFSLWPTHRTNYQDMAQRWVRRSLLVEEMITIFRDLDIEYRMLPLDVNTRNIASARLPSVWTS